MVMYKPNFGSKPSGRISNLCFQEKNGGAVMGIILQTFISRKSEYLILSFVFASCSLSA
jgi:hypothetical protein